MSRNGRTTLASLYKVMPILGGRLGATKLTGVDDDELFYLRNKATIDGTGLSLAGTVVA